MKRYRFEAAIQRSQGWGAFVFFPHDATQEFHSRGRVPVQVRFQDVPYTGSLMPHGDGYHRLSVPRTVLTTLAKSPGELLQVELWKDETTRVVEMPADLEALLHREHLAPAFAALTLTRRKEYRNWITSAKRPETRQRRIAEAIDLLRSEIGMQAPVGVPAGGLRRASAKTLK